MCTESVSAMLQKDFHLFLGKNDLRSLVVNQDLSPFLVGSKAPGNRQLTCLHSLDAKFLPTKVDSQCGTGTQMTCMSDLVVIIVNSPWTGRAVQG